ncbi:MAG TPA: hypothetical protein VNI55_11390 [Gaiellaceae bacterium]|nr:hypothetical protein [Gaiellaceae bacterium]
MILATSTALLLGLAGIGVAGTLGGSFIGFWGARMIETKRQSFQREQDAKDDRARALHATRILDLALMEAEALLGTVEKNHRLWPDTIKVPADSDWLELRAVVAPILDPEPWWAVHLGFLAVTHLHDFEAGCRKLGYDETKDLEPRTRENLDPILRDIRKAREALAPVAYPDHVRLPDGRFMPPALPPGPSSKHNEVAP